MTLSLAGTRFRRQPAIGLRTAMLGVLFRAIPGPECGAGCSVVPSSGIIIERVTGNFKARHTVYGGCRRPLEGFTARHLIGKFTALLCNRRSDHLMLMMSAIKWHFEVSREPVVVWLLIVWPGWLRCVVVVVAGRGCRRLRGEPRRARQRLGKGVELHEQAGSCRP